MPMEDRATRRSNYFLKIIQLLDDYPKCFVVGVDNVGSVQTQQTWVSLRGKAVVLVGKNTMTRKALQGASGKEPSSGETTASLPGNVGSVFTEEDLTEIRGVLLATKVLAPPLLLPLARMRSLCQLRTLVWGRRRPLSPRLSASPLKSPQVPLKFWVMCSW